MALRSLLVGVFLLCAIAIGFWSKQEQAQTTELASQVGQGPPQLHLPASQRTADTSSSTANPSSKTAQTSLPNQVGPAHMAFTRLQNSSARPWVIDKTQENGYPKTISGGMWMADHGSLEEKARQFLNDYAQDLLGVESDQLVMTQQIKMDRTKIVFQQTINAVPVYSAYVALVFENDQLVRVQNDLAPVQSAPIAEGLTPEQAWQWLQKNGSTRRQVASSSESLTAIEPMKQMYYVSQNRVIPAYRFLVQARTSEGAVHREILMDAADPHLIFSHDTHRH